MSRGRRDRVAAALRHFGLVDRFDLMSLLGSDALPTEADLAQGIGRFPEALPDGITAKYLAWFIAEELARGDEVAPTGEKPLSHRDIDALRAILPGRKAAHRYHRLMLRILSGVFAGRLVDPVIEAEHSEGRKRIDIRFRNADQTGFFAELQGHEIKAQYIIVECKNHSEDPKNPEFAQLADRLNPKVGRLGIMVLRSVKDRARMDEHRKDRRAKSDWILVLDDDDVVAMLEASFRGDPAAVDATLREKLEPLLFD